MTEKSLRFPITTLMIYAGIFLLGIISFNRLQVSLLPDIEFPEVTILTEYESASAREIEHLVSKPIEEAVASVSGVKDISSISSEGISIVKVKFIWGKNMDFAGMEMREKVDLIKGSLPQDVKRPVILKYSPSDTPILSLSVSSRTYGRIELRQIAEKEIRSALERISGVAAVNITGGLVREVRINIDSARLFSNNLSLPEVIETLNLANYNFPAGSIRKEKKEFIIRVIGEFENLDQIRNLILATGEKGQPVYLRDVADISDSYRERTSSSRYNGLEDINLTIQKEALKNTVEADKNVREELEALKARYRGKVELHIIYSQAAFIRSSMNSLIFAAFLGGIIAFLVLLLFLNDLKTSLIIIISIPVSALVVFIFMFLRNITLNMISMGGIAIGVGMVVDNSIVVLESISRKLSGIHGGGDRAMLKKSILEGTEEVRTSVIASTLTTVVVFLPIIFVQGIAGAIFGQLAFTITVSLLSSLYISLTLVPLLYSFPLDIRFSLPLITKFLGLYEKAEKFYVNKLKQLLLMKRKVILTGPVLMAAGLMLLIVIKKELLPPVDEGKFRIRLEAPSGTPLALTEEYVSSVERQVLARKDKVASVYTVIGYDEKNIVFNQTERMNINSALLNVILKKRGGTGEFIRDLARTLRPPASAKISFINVQEVIPGLAAFQKKGFLIAVRGSDLQNIRNTAEKLTSYLLSRGGFTDMANESGEPAQEYHLRLDREAMSSLGLNVRLVAETLQSAIKGKRATFLRVEDDEYDIRVRLREEDRLDQTFLHKLFIKNGVYGINVPLSAFASLAREKGETAIFRENQERIMYLSFNYKGSRSNLEKLLSVFQPEPDCDVRLAGLDRETRDSIRDLILAFILSVLLVYMILASQFESLRQPFIIMFSTPLILTGAGLGLLLTGHSVNVISSMGLVMLSGIVVNNAIIMFEYFLVLKKKGMEIEKAVLTGCKIRMRPVMMTTLTTIVGLVPLALSLGSGSEIQSPMAITVISGLAFGTLLTLVYIP